MSREEEILQEKVAAGQAPDNADGRAYVKVFSALSREPEVNLPMSFADRIVQRALALKQARESKKDMWWLGLGIFLLVLAFAISFSFVDFKMNTGFLRTIGDFKWLLLSGGVLIWIFNIIDKKFVRPTDMRI